MPAAPIPADEDLRLESLRKLEILDTEPEIEFDSLVQAAALVCGVPISLVSLIDVDRQWFKANVGLPGATQTPRDVAFCAHAILQDGVFEVPDATADPRFAQNALVVSDPSIRFYAGAVLKLSDGTHAGTLCVIDRQPRQLDATQREILQHLARAAVQALEGRRALKAERDLRLQLLSVASDLANSEARFRALSDASPLGVFATDRDGICTYTNARWQEIYGLTLEQALGNGWAAPLHPDDRNEVWSQWLGAAASGTQFDMEFRIRHADSTVHYVHARAKATLDALGEVNGYVGSVEDVTERRALHTELAEQHELLRVTLQSIGDAVITTDAHGRVTWLNPVAERMTGWRNDDARGCAIEQVFRVFHEQTREPARNPVSCCLQLGQAAELSRDTVLVAQDGQAFGIEDSAAPIRDEDGQLLGAVLVFRDVTEQRRLSGEMSYRAKHDALTGLVNRAEFEARLRNVLNKAHEDRSQHALMYIDLDQFKLVNDACGHSVGDRLLQQVSKLLGESVRARDTLARLGGDEFAVILEHCSTDQAQRVAQQICERMDDFRFIHEERRFRIGASIGLVPLDHRWATPAALMQAADTACYAAKEAGRNRVHAWFDTDEAVRARQGEMQWASRLQHALEDNRFELHAQRITPLGGGHAGLHAEVLLRLRDTDGALVMPGAFLPAAERFHLASRVDRWVLRRVVETLRSRADLSGIASLGVNLSGQSIGDRAFHRQALELLQAAGHAVCSRLCLEITETVAVTNMADASLFVEQVRGLGIRVALDDFGAGASSFGYLKSLPVDVIKIDGQFIRDLPDDPLDEAAVRCFVDVARVVGVQTVAEFVDRPAVLERVKQIGIDYAQGYLAHVPEPLDALLSELSAAAQP